MFTRNRALLTIKSISARREHQFIFSFKSYSVNQAPCGKEFLILWIVEIPVVGLGMYYMVSALDFIDTVCPAPSITYIYG